MLKLMQIGAGRCCIVYSGSAVRDGSLVALKIFKHGENYEGALQREQYVLDAFKGTQHNVVQCYGYLMYRGYHCLVLELLDTNIRQVCMKTRICTSFEQFKIIYQNNRQGLSAWMISKFAKDLFISLKSLHKECLVHADLKPANVLWSPQDGVFKCIDFGLSFNTEEDDLHQIQSTGRLKIRTEEIFINYLKTFI